MLRATDVPMETEKDVRRMVSPRSDAWEPHLFLVIEGARPTAGGLRCSLADIDEVALGRDDLRSVSPGAAARSLAVGIPDRKVSIRHARLIRARGDWKIQDEGSTNGTFVNGRRVIDQGLCDGDVVEVGRSVLRLRLALATPEETPRVSADGAGLGSDLRLATLLPALAGDLASLARVASSKVPVLLLGDTGTGKELVARAIHASSNRSGDMIAINCAALPHALVEAQFFGHKKGAFSGAVREELGFVRAAQGGTLFLDEIGDLPGPAQGALLRVLQNSEVVPVGATRPVAVDIRVIAATHQPLAAMVERGAFRRDLFARLQGFTHRLWPLAERREDIGLLVADHLTRLAPVEAEDLQISADAARALVLHSWPLNVRELVQVLARALPLARDGTIESGHLPAALSVLAQSPPQLAGPPADLPPQDLALRADLVNRLERCEGNVAEVAREMKKGTIQVYRWMQKLGINPKAFR